MWELKDNYQTNGTIDEEARGLVENKEIIDRITTDEKVETIVNHILLINLIRWLICL